jgi:hypothetical protein
MLLSSLSGTVFLLCCLVRYSAFAVGSGTIPHQTTLSAGTTTFVMMRRQTLVYFHVHKLILVRHSHKDLVCEFDVVFWIKLILSTLTISNAIAGIVRLTLMTTYKMTSNIIVPNLILILNFNSSGDILTGDQNITNHDNLRKIISQWQFDSENTQGHEKPLLYDSRCC